MKAFMMGLSRMVREGETQPLEFVIGFLAMVLGAQYAAGLLGLTDLHPLVAHVPGWLAWIVAVILLVGGITKIYGAVLDHIWARRCSALGLSGVWLSIILANLGNVTIFSTILFAILALQSAWIYIRLSILKTRPHVS